MDRSLSTRRCARSAFTLIELLVCASIISVLVGLSMTGLTKARSCARGVVCQASLRNLAQAVNLYYNERNDLPTTNQHIINLPAGQRAIVDMLAPFHDAPEPSTEQCIRPWACPSDTTRRQNTGGTYIYYPASLYVNYGLQPPRHNLRSLLNRNPRMPLFLDGLPLHGPNFHTVLFDGCVDSSSAPINFAI
ncbi:MAG TPA: type II secretion system protein [Phycisphaerales bacterium]|nr:type II secretion system protein [Phycisphaerales bacterium]